MSTFCGIIKEIPHISVDKFDENFESLAYFLSHCHQDHTKGLFPFLNYCFGDRLLGNNDIFLYASNVSVEILKRRQPVLATKYKVLPIGRASLVPVGNKYVSVTLIPAGHCPGSVMFLFEYENKNILYTGDYRLNPDDYSKIKAFYDASGQVKRIEKIYLDTTFFLEDFKSFPSRENALNKMVNVIKDWIKRSERHIIHVDAPATYGSEYLFVELSKRLQMPIHLSPEKYDFYNCIPEMDNCITLDGAETRLHTGCGSKYYLICVDFTSCTLVFRPSALSWTTKQPQDDAICQGNSAKVCYSCHASLEEGVSLLRFLKPDEIEPNVVPENVDKQNEMMTLIEQVMREYKTQKDEIENKEPVKLLSTENLRIKPRKSNAKIDDFEFSDLLDSPPRDSKKKRCDESP